MNQWRNNDEETRILLGQDTDTGTVHYGFAEPFSSVNTHINTDETSIWSRILPLICRVLVLIAGFAIACCLTGFAFVLAIYSAFAFDSGSQDTAIRLACFNILYAILLLIIALAIFICSILFAVKKIGFPTFRRVILRILAFCFVAALLEIFPFAIFPSGGVWWFDFWLVRIYLPMYLSWKLLQKYYWGGETLLNLLLDRSTVDNSNFEASHPLELVEIEAHNHHFRKKNLT